ncbi:MAG: hypothetical protein WCK90_00060 [archaeon]
MTKGKSKRSREGKPSKLEAPDQTGRSHGVKFFFSDVISDYFARQALEAGERNVVIRYEGHKGPSDYTRENQIFYASFMPMKRGESMPKSRFYQDSRHPYMEDVRSDDSCALSGYVANNVAELLKMFEDYRASTKNAPVAILHGRSKLAGEIVLSPDVVVKKVPSGRVEQGVFDFYNSVGN